jgi:uncharacterized protein
MEGVLLPTNRIITGDKMMNRTVAASVVAFALTLGWSVMSYAVDPPAPASAATSKKNRVVVQVSDSDPGKWNLALNNAGNLQKDVGAANVDIEMVVYGPGIGMLKSDSMVGHRVKEALGNGVKIVACENTMQGQKLAKSDMLPNIGYIQSGVVEVMQKQQEGWSYIKP